MTARPFLRRSASTFALALLVAAVIVPATGGFLVAPAEAASEIAVIVNKEPITTFMIRQRAAFLKLRRVSGNLNEQATNEMIDEALKKQETRRRGISVPDAAVDAAFAKFASDNKLQVGQLTQILARAGFSDKAFKDYIRVQMGWGQAVQMNLRGGGGRVTEADAVQRMLQQGGNKPSTTEYILQQVIFVVPDGKKNMVAGRLREANAMRARFQSCPASYDFAKGLRDVTVRELGRVAQPELPPRWKDSVTKISGSGTTPAQETERGVEYLAVCDQRSVSDDKVAAMVFQTQDMEKLGKSEPDAALLKKLKDKAQIVKR